MKRIIWLASYPKSGNTWMRVFFTNLRRDDAAPADINDLDRTVMAYDRDLFDRVVGYEAGDLTHEEVDLLRPDYYRYLAARAGEPFYCKVHDAYTRLPDGQPMFPPQATAGVLYLIRNPLDVCVSFAHHAGMRDCEQVIAWMADSQISLIGRRDRQDPQSLRQRLLKWSEHVLSWVDAPDLRIHVVRYEDMKARPVETFMAASAFIGMTSDRAKITRAVEFSSIEELQRQESKNGFREAMRPSRSFFRKGGVGSWRNALTEGQVARVIEDHKEVMLRFGYLTPSGEAVD